MSEWSSRIRTTHTEVGEGSEGKYKEKARFETGPKWVRGNESSNRMPETNLKSNRVSESHREASEN